MSQSQSSEPTTTCLTCGNEYKRIAQHYGSCECSPPYFDADDCLDLLEDGYVLSQLHQKNGYMLVMDDDGVIHTNKRDTFERSNPFIISTLNHYDWCPRERETVDANWCP